jgi:hypothetical protein
MPHSIATFEHAGNVPMIVCLRTVEVPSPEREQFLNWIQENRDVRESNGILLELVLESADGPLTVITAWPSHEVFDAWISTPDRDRLTRSNVHASVHYQPITRHEVIGGYLNLKALSKRGALI